MRSTANTNMSNSIITAAPANIVIASSNPNNTIINTLDNSALASNNATAAYMNSNNVGIGNNVTLIQGNSNHPNPSIINNGVVLAAANVTSSPLQVQAHTGHLSSQPNLITAPVQGNQNLLVGPNPTNTLVQQRTRPSLTPVEIAAVRQLITGYRESAAFLLRSAEELQNLIHQQGS